MVKELSTHYKLNLFITETIKMVANFNISHIIVKKKNTGKCSRDVHIRFKKH